MLTYLSKALRFGEGKKLKVLESLVSAVNSWEEEFTGLSDAELLSKTAEFRKRLKDGETTDDLLPEAYAAVREASKRAMNMRHFDVQIMGGIVLHQGKIAEMRTGEGKTLVATLPSYLNALTGNSVHVVTVNDYLAKRDSEWMSPVFKKLGITVGLIQAHMDPSQRVTAYQADIIYGTNSEFGFDYLRDNMVVSPEHRVQRDHHFAIVDEVDSILIDEARTPLIISGPSEQGAQVYPTFARIVPRLKAGRDYEVDEKLRTVAVTEEGVARVEKELNIPNLYDDIHSQLINHLIQALKAHTLFKRDVDYIIKNGEVILVDEFTGRLMEGRRYSEGLHQAIEAKEKVRIQEENQTLATITLQNYFRMYDKLSGMTGTAATEADEFLHIYKLETVTIPTHRDMVRDDMNDLIYKTEASKFEAVAEDIAQRHQDGQPVLVGTISIERSEVLSRMLKQKGIPHNVLNAKQHEREAEIIAQAGKRGAVTIATNMAGRGVDIILGGNPPEAGEAEFVREAGGLHVLGTERHESRRIDNQLRGRSGRQGDPGSTQFFISTEDDLMRLFGGQKLAGMMDRLSLPDDAPIEHPWISRSIESAQRQVESQNFELRKHVLKYDDVMNQQRTVIYEQRSRILDGEDIHDTSMEMLEEVISSAVMSFAVEESAEDWDWEALMAYLKQLYPCRIDKDSLDLETIIAPELVDLVVEDATEVYKQREQELGPDILREMERYVMLEVLDNRWKDHLYEMDYLREGIGLRAVGQQDPLVEYKGEGFRMFQNMIEGTKEDFVRYIFRIEIVPERDEEEEKLLPILMGAGTSSADGGSKQPVKNSSNKVGRNDPCPCGSGKKYKKCHGA